MKPRTKLFLRFAGIGMMHATLYLVIVPFVILPLFAKGDEGIVFAMVGAVSVCIALWILFRPLYHKRGTAEEKKVSERTSKKGSAVLTK